MKKGISLITLIITIIVIIILSAAVILTISNTGVIDNAKIASLASDQSNLQTSIELYFTDVATENLDFELNKEKILFGYYSDEFRIIEKNGENVVEEVIEKNGEEIKVYKLDKAICEAKQIEVPKTPSNTCAWYISLEGQVYLVYEEDAIISAWIIGNPPEGKQIESDVLDKFVAKIGEWEKEPDITELIPVADANMFEYTTATNGTVKIKGFNSEYDGEVPTEIKFPTIDPNGNTIIGINSSAFSGNTNLTTIIIPEGVTTLGSCAFKDCTALKEVYLPTTLTSIRTGGTDGTFMNCSSIEKITIPNAVVSGTCSTPKNIFGWSTATIKEIEFNETVTSIGNNAFTAMTALEKIEIPDTITSIGNSAFKDCTSLTGKITIPQNVVSIGNNAFDNCKNINEIEFLSKGELVSIGSSAFYNLPNLTSVKIPEGVTTLGNIAFKNCTSLKEVYLPTTLTSITTGGTSATFMDCRAIEKITIPNAVVSGTCSTPNNIFGFSVATIKEIEFNETVTLIGNNAFSGFKALERIEIPDTVTSIGNSAFKDCTALSGKITIPENVESIGNNAFQNCKNITEMEFLSKGKLVSIGNSAFLSASAMVSLKIPEGVTTLGTYAFGQCTSLKEVSLPTTIATIYIAGNNATFHSCNAIEKITIPNVVASGTIATPANVFSWSRASIKEVNFMQDVNTIASNAFISCTGLQSITIPNTVTSIASNAFSSCTNLTKIVYSGTATGSPWGATNATVVAQ